MPAMRKKIDRDKPGTSPYPLVAHGLEKLCVPIGSIRPWEDNPRDNDDASRELAESIRANQFRDPIEVDQHDVIRVGHTRWKAARLLGMTHVPVIRSWYETPAAAVAYAIANNREGERAEWDPEKLLALQRSRAFEGYRGRTGFTENELLKLAKRLRPPEQFERVDPDGEMRHSCPRCGYEWR